MKVYVKDVKDVTKNIALIYDSVPCKRHWWGGGLLRFGCDGRSEQLGKYRKPVE